MPYKDLNTGEITQVTIGEFMDKILPDSMARIKKNPLIMINVNFMAKKIFKVDHYYHDNIMQMRNFMRNIIEARKKEKDDSATDFVSLLIQNEQYQNTEDIIDDLIIMFFAGSKTVQATTSNLITRMTEEPEIYAQLKKEIDTYMDGVKDNIKEKMTLESVEELEYVKMCYQETLRLDSPASMSKICNMSKDVSISGVDLREGDPFMIATGFMQKDPEQWKEPNRFEPQRFNPKSEWFLKPDGKTKRNPYAYSPFAGGVRVCLGKTFAEVVLKFSIPLYYHYFDFELV